MCFEVDRSSVKPVAMDPFVFVHFHHTKSQTSLLGYQMSTLPKGTMIHPRNVLQWHITMENCHRNSETGEGPRPGLRVAASGHLGESQGISTWSHGKIRKSWMVFVMFYDILEISMIH